MKKFSAFLSIAVAMTAIAFVSCSKEQEKEEEVPAAQSSIPSLTFAITDSEATKALLGDNDGKKFGQIISNENKVFIHSVTVVY